jgi:hypothetical protein
MDRRKTVLSVKLDMEITIELPDEIARHLGDASKMPRQMLEAFAA